ncbi:hypothetical protein [Umezawaea tangerina]|uniref:HAF family extracellular repeat protein n=1 Tax=Umezawaea tangerina TaxID=84725 RepID=A0A2T0SX99_9PSEU|nr:hypothetical protein [Umezawaea tangerina]PRY38054.1 hypothetical protein CLV43_109274 [Umezawaea tangerina]
MRFRYPVTIALVLAAISSPTASAATCTWTPTILPLPAGMTTGTVYAADSGGGYAGVASGDGATSHAVRWSGGTATDYGTVPGYGPYVSVKGVNRNGVVVGSTSAATGNRQRAFRSVGTALQALPEPAGANHSWATAVNDNGDVVGNIGADVTIGGSSYLVNTAVLWPANAPGTVVELTAGLPTTGQTIARGVDQDGTVLVEHFPTTTSFLDADVLHLWRAGSARALPAPSGASSVAGNAISNGRVAGGSTVLGDLSATVWEPNGTIVKPAAADYTTSVNRTGQTVGWKAGPSLNMTYSVWQGTTKVGTYSGRWGLTASADNGTVAGWNRTAANSPNQPAYYRCL